MEDCNLLYEISVKDSKDAFKILFEDYYSLLCIYSKRFIDDIEAREDIVQGVFVSIWEQRKIICVNSCVRNYLITCTRNACVNFLRRNSKSKRTDVSELERIPVYSESSDAVYSLVELESMLKKALSKLPEDYRKVYELSRNEEKKNYEIAEILGVSTKTIERHKMRINNHLRKELKDFLPLFLVLVLLKK